MAIVDLVFTRTSTVVETGHVQIEVDDPDNMNKVFGAAERKEFKQYLVAERDYDPEDDDWDFEIVEKDNDEVS